jgi:alanine-glyoxylate transaminase/serine-glyoxylate transaminase/serine-pyruvate transaminase
VKEFNAPFRILMGPGPSNVDPRVLRAMSQTMLSHLDPVFIRVMDDVQEALRQVFQTKSPITLPISGTGTAGMETAMVNMIEPGDTVLILSAGYFADRMAEIAGRAGGRVERLDAPWGRVFEADEVRKAVDRVRPRVVAFVHVETSTGTSQPIEPLAEVLNRDDIITIMDCVASLAGEPIDVEGNGLDFVYSGSQKCLSCPPGLAPITLSDKAIRRLSERKVPVQSWYLDLVMLRKYWSDVRVYHHTAPVSLNYALREALRIIEEETLPKLYARHRLNHEALVAGLEAMGLEMFVEKAARAWTLNTVKVPEGIDDQKLRSSLLERYGIEIVGGLGTLKGKVWRIGLMGYSSRSNNVLLLLGAMEELLAEMGFTGGPGGAGVRAASALYRSAGRVEADLRPLREEGPVRVG